MSANEIPMPPQEISGDGRELWDWAGKFSEAVHRRDSIRTLNIRIAAIGTRCGDCDKWMKSKECPAERHDNAKGRSVGPSCEGRICGSFIEATLATKRRDSLKVELASFANSSAPKASREGA